MVSVPDKFNAIEASTQRLTALHAELDDAITGKGGASLGELTLVYAKQVKCAIKTELAKRANAGDSAAKAYARQRRWDQKAAPRLAVAAE